MKRSEGLLYFTGMFSCIKGVIIMLLAVTQKFNNLHLLFYSSFYAA